MALMLCPLLGSRRNQTEPVVNRISEVLLDLLANALSTVTLQGKQSLLTRFDHQTISLLSR